MNAMGFVGRALSPFAAFGEHDEGVAIPTHCLYPSNATVTVYVTGSSTGAVVSDDGGAIGELTTHNCVVANPDQFLRRFCRSTGLKAKNGKILSPVVTDEQLIAAVMFVANASAAATRAGLEEFKPRRRRNLRKNLLEVVNRNFQKDHIEIDRRLLGKSSRTYKFDSVIHIGRGRLLVMDTVLPDPNSINSHVVSHLDLHQLEDNKIVQRLVYDDQEDWNSADISVLQMAATLVPFSRVESSLGKFSDKQR